MDQAAAQAGSLPLEEEKYEDEAIKNFDKHAEIKQHPNEESLDASFQGMQRDLSQQVGTLNGRIGSDAISVIMFASFQQQQLESSESDISLDLEDVVKGKNMMEALRQRFEEDDKKDNQSKSASNSSDGAIQNRIVPDVQDIQEGLLMPQLKAEVNLFTKKTFTDDEVTSSTAPILIVEDNSFCYYALTSILQQYQLEFDSAWDGGWAVEMV